MGKYILAIDPGTQCGWATRAPNGRTISGVWDLKGSRYEGGGMRLIRFRDYFDKLLDFAESQQPIYDGLIELVVVYEEIRRHLGTDAAHFYGEVTGQIKVACEDREIPYQAIPVGTIKKFATGKGNTNKQTMIAAARAKWPQANITDDNEADARWIAECAASQLGE